MKKQYVIDTNLILRYLLEDNKSQYKQSKALFDRAMAGEISLILEHAVFTEVIYVLTSFYDIPKDEMVSLMLFLITYKGLECEAELLKNALLYFKHHNIHIVDALLLSRSKLQGVELLTFDKKLKKIAQNSN